MCAQAGMTYRGLLDLQPQIKTLGNRAQYSKSGGRDFRADAVTGKNKEVHGYCPSTVGHHRFFLGQEKSGGMHLARPGSYFICVIGSPT